MGHEASDRISAAAERDPESLTATTGFDGRAEARPSVTTRRSTSTTRTSTTTKRSRRIAM
jgi:hypothetical protein